MREEDVPYESSGIARILKAIKTLLLHLQAQDEWCSGKGWEIYPNHTVLDGEKNGFSGKWSVDDVKLVRCDGAVYVLNDPATRQEIIRANHDDL